MRPFHLLHLKTLPSGIGLEFDQPHHLQSFPPYPPVSGLDQPGEDLGENADRPARIGVRQCRSGEFAGAQVVMVLRVGVEGRFQRPETFNPGQLRIAQRHEMIPALERFVVGVPVVPVHNLLKLLTIDRFEQTRNDAIGKSHARSFCVSTTRKTDLLRLDRACTVT